MLLKQILEMAVKLFFPLKVTMDATHLLKDSEIIVEATVKHGPADLMAPVHKGSSAGSASCPGALLRAHCCCPPGGHGQAVVPLATMVTQGELGPPLVVRCV